MFHFLFKKKPYLNLSPQDVNDYQLVLDEIRQLLLTAKLFAQAGVIEKLSSLLLEGEYRKFNILICSIDMWGGAGAVWEVDMLNNLLQREFESKIIKLITLMEQTNITNSSIRKIKRKFQNNS